MPQLINESCEAGIISYLHLIDEVETQRLSKCPRTILFFTVLGLELRAYILSHSTSPIFVKVFFKIGSYKLLA
jgi:hypothetical protein